MLAFYEQRQRPFDTFETESLSFIPHIHGHVELVLVREGAMHLAIGAHERTLGPGELAIVFPNTVHGYQTGRHSVARLVIFDVELVKEYAPQLNRRQPTEPFLSADRIHADALFALGALERGAPDSTELLRGYLLVLVGRVLAEMTLEQRPAPMDEDLLHRLLMYLDEHFRRPLTLDEIGAALGASRYQISRCFSRRIGCNFNSYVNALRAACAADLLLQSGRSVADVGYDSGFDSLSTFYRAFQTQYGQSPKAYRDHALRTP